MKKVLFIGLVLMGLVFGNEVSAVTRDQLKAQLVAAGIQFSTKALKAELAALVATIPVAPANPVAAPPSACIRAANPWRRVPRRPFPRARRQKSARG